MLQPAPRTYLFRGYVTKSTIFKHVWPQSLENIQSMHSESSILRCLSRNTNKKYGMKKGQFHGQKHVIICCFSGRVFRMSPPSFASRASAVDILSNDFDVITQKIDKLSLLLQPVPVSPTILTL